jgi:hypothetical protein
MIAEENNISILTSFNLRHKVLKAIKKYIDNIVMNIGGLGRGTIKMLDEQLSDKVEKVDLITADSASAYQEFCKKHNIKLVAMN